MLPRKAIFSSQAVHPHHRWRGGELCLPPRGGDRERERERERETQRAREKRDSERETEIEIESHRERVSAADFYLCCCSATELRAPAALLGGIGQ